MKKCEVNSIYNKLKTIEVYKDNIDSCLRIYRKGLECGVNVLSSDLTCCIEKLKCMSDILIDLFNELKELSIYESSGTDEGLQR